MVRFPAPLRTVREEPEFAADLRAIFSGVVPNPQLLDEMLKGVVFALARDPHIGARIMSTNIWAVPVDMPPVGRSIRIYYEFDENRVLLRGATERSLAATAAHLVAGRTAARRAYAGSCGILAPGRGRGRCR